MTAADPFAIHFNARIRAMRSRLFTRARIEDILDQQDLGVTIELLLNSPYAEPLAVALARYEGADAVEHAVTQDMTNVFQRLMYRAEGRYRELTALFLLRWDLTAVKSLLRHVSRPRARVPGPVLAAGPSLPAGLLEELAQRATVAETIAGLIAWNPVLCAPLTGSLAAQFDAERNPAPLEEALDRGYFVDNARRLAADPDENARELRRVLQMEIDRINLRRLFPLLEAGTAPGVIAAGLLPEGGLTRRTLARLAHSGSVVDAMELLTGTMYREFIEGLYQFLQTRRFSPLERFFELTIMRQVRRMARAWPLSIAVLMDYAWHKYNEVTNLRLIARGEARHLPRGLVREELLFA